MDLPLKIGVAVYHFKFAKARMYQIEYQFINNYIDRLDFHSTDSHGLNTKNFFSCIFRRYPGHWKDHQTGNEQGIYIYIYNQKVRNRAQHDMIMLGRLNETI